MFGKILVMVLKSYIVIFFINKIFLLPSKFHFEALGSSNGEHDSEIIVSHNKVIFKSKRNFSTLETVTVSTSLLGVYLYSFEAQSLNGKKFFSEVKKMIYLK